MKKVRFIEFSLAIGLVFSLALSAYAANKQETLAGKLLRLHVIANSDSTADQELKFIVRDRVLALADEYSALAQTPEQAREIIRKNLSTIEKAAQKEVYSCGYSYPVKAELTNMYFNTRNYDTFSLPAGYYDAFRIIIGNGQGRNWWCVMFPPLCISAAQEDFLTAAEEAGLSEEECKLITSGQPVYRYKFKLIEWFSKLQNTLSKRS